MKNLALLLLLLLLNVFVDVVLSFPYRYSPSSFVVDLKKGENQLLLNVARMVDLIEEDNTLVFAERTLAIRFELDVVDKQIMFNDQPIELGVSTFQVEAQIITKPNNLQIRMMQEKSESGLVTVQVTANLLAESAVIVDDMVFRRIEIKQDIIKVNGELVRQTNAGHQMIDMFDCGSFIKWSVDPDSELPPPLSQGKERESNGVIRGFIGGSLCTMFFGIVFALREYIRNDQVEDEELDAPPAYHDLSKQNDHCFMYGVS
ncbi:hypothetical protein K501DRAFT_304371 [Backusella circina FSU 941]|nr:hypothetical protein K501DRAFT_304371 [Backusella circina FSU 941]